MTRTERMQAPGPVPTDFKCPHLAQEPPAGVLLPLRHLVLTRWPALPSARFPAGAAPRARVQSGWIDGERIKLQGYIDLSLPELQALINRNSLWGVGGTERLLIPHTGNRALHPRKRPSALCLQSQREKAVTLLFVLLLTTRIRVAK